MQTLLPHNASPLETKTETVLREPLAINVPTDTLWDAWSCPVKLLPVLAWALSVGDWDPAWSEKSKRSVIEIATRVHRVKGTKGAMRRALAALNLGISISEWFEYGGAPYHFRVDINLYDRGVSEAELIRIKSAIMHTKNARSWLERLRVYLTGSARSFSGAAVMTGHTISVDPWFPDIPAMTAPLQSAMATHLVHTLTVEAAA